MATRKNRKERHWDNKPHEGVPNMTKLRFVDSAGEPTYAPPGRKILEVQVTSEDYDGRAVEKKGEPLEVNHPGMCETPIAWRILGRVNGGDWRWENAGETLESVTFRRQGQMTGHLSWLRRHSDQIKEATVEYMVVPVFGMERDL